MKRKELTRKEYKHKLLVYMPYVVLHVLLKNKALGLYCNNALSTKADFFSSIYYIHSNDPLVWLNNVFYWEYTPEGLEFWGNIFEQTVVEINKAYETNKKRKTAISDWLREHRDNL